VRTLEYSSKVDVLAPLCEVAVRLQIVFLRERSSSIIPQSRLRQEFVGFLLVAVLSLFWSVRMSIWILTAPLAFCLGLAPNSPTAFELVCHGAGLL